MKREIILNDMYRHLVSCGDIKTQLDIVRAIGSCKSSVSSAFGGHKRYLTLSFLNRINSAFGNKFNPSWIETGAGEMLNDARDYKSKWIEALRRVAELEAEIAEYKSIKVF